MTVKEAAKFLGVSPSDTSSRTDFGNRGFQLCFLDSGFFAARLGSKAPEIPPAYLKYHGVSLADDYELVALEEVRSVLGLYDGDTLVYRGEFEFDEKHVKFRSETRPRQGGGFTLDELMSVDGGPEEKVLRDRAVPR